MNYCSSEHNCVNGEILVSFYWKVLSGSELVYMTMNKINKRRESSPQEVELYRVLVVGRMIL